MEQLSGQPCPMCHKKTLTLAEDKTSVPHFGMVFVFSMTCSNCKYAMSDVEPEADHPPQRYTFTIESEKDLKVRVVKSSNASVKVPQMRMSVAPAGNSIGYVSNIEGVLNRFKKIIEDQRDNAEDAKVRKSAKNLLKKLWKVSLGEVHLKVVIEDPSGNSVIVSDKAIVEPMKGKKQK
tara:strand:- start:156 stop:689 length:534 start_codon:yes stop_codon:yes gene_type:complete